MTNYYNEFDAYAAKHIQNLIDNKIIAHGVVDTRSIEDVRPDDLKGFTQCHFFAGIAGWSYALDLAGWPRSRPVWTGSCPCQPFSAAGEGNGFEDERHLWPSWQHLIAQCDPPEIIGEQVASKAAEPWIDLVQADLEGMGYTFGCFPFPAASIGAPHIRDRLYWVAHANNARLEGWNLPGQRPSQLAPWSGGVVVRGQDGIQRPVEPSAQPLAHGVSGRVGRLRAYGNAIVPQQAAEFVRAYMEARNMTATRTPKEQTK